MASMLGVTRGCGSRVAGGIYAEVTLHDSGRALEEFIVCPPHIINPADHGLTPVGVKLIQHDGIWHLLDWVGSEDYPNVSDFLEEARRFGISRRLPKNLDYSKLTPGARLLLVHSRGHIENWFDYYNASEWSCPQKLPSHDSKNGEPPDFTPREMCAGLWREDVDYGIPNPLFSNDERGIERLFPAFSYTARTRPQGVTPQYLPAIFASFPIVNLAVIRDTLASTHASSLLFANNSLLPVLLEDA